MNWQETIRAALRPTPQVAPMNAFERIVREVVDFVNENEPSFRAVVHAKFIGTLQRLDVITYPRRYPVERSIMLSISVATTGEVLVPTPAGLGRLTDASPESLRTYLVEFFSSPNFVATIHHYRIRNEEPIQGWLKKLSHRKVDLADVSVLIDTEQQDKLVIAYETGNFTDEVEIKAKLLTPFGNFLPYSENTSYTMLESAGFVLRCVKHSLVGNETLTIVGVPMDGKDGLLAT